MARVLAGLPAEQGTRHKDREAAKEIKRVRVRAPPSCWLAVSFPLSFCFLLRLFSSPYSLLLFLSVSTPPASAFFFFFRFCFATPFCQSSPPPFFFWRLWPLYIECLAMKIDLQLDFDARILESLAGCETEEDEEGNPIKMPTRLGKMKLYPYIRSVEIKDPNFRLGLLFPNVEQLREAVSECAIKNQIGMWFEKNTKKKMQVKCQWGCPFYMVAEEVKERLLVDEDWSRKGIHNHIEDTYNIDIPMQTITRGKRAARKIIEGHYIEQYNKLAAYRKELLRSNPGSTVEIMTELDGPVRRFKRMYICFQACKEGWMKGCMPLIGLDGCHIKGHHPGQLLTVIGIDANNEIFLIAYAMVERESEGTYIWFLEYLQQDVKIERDSSYVFMTDKQKRLDNALKVLFPNSEHRHCVRHLHNNFKQKHPGEVLKQLMWNASRSTTVTWFNKHIDEMKMVKDKAVDWFDDKNPNHWSRAFCVIHFGKRGKLSPRYIGPYETTERVGPVPYRLRLSPELSRIHDVFHVSMLRKYVVDPSHVLQEQPISLKKDLTYEEEPVQIIDQEEKVLRNKTVRLVKVLWRSHQVEEATWEAEDQMRQQYPHLFY
ncbi:hypothetical protein ACLB2K_072655 [Fragaria x ananassa]